MRREYIAGAAAKKIARFSSGLAGSNYDYKIELIASEKTPDTPQRTRSAQACS